MNQPTPTILIIDDDIHTINLLRVILHSEGFSTLQAEDGASGYALAQSASPDLILLDIMLPREDGFVICSKLKQDPKTGAIPVIFLSAISDAKSKTRGLTIGGVDYITKPFDNDEVTARVRLHLKCRYAFQAITEHQQNLCLMREAQQALLVRPEDCPEAAFAVCYQPLHAAGGDFYDVVHVSHGIFGYLAADISGHDIGASFATPALKAIIRQNAALQFTPTETMMMLDRAIRVVLKPGQYLTACYARLNRNLAKLEVVAAGHPPLIYLEKQGAPRLASAASDLLGAYDEPVRFERWETNTAPGDRFFLCTDGLIDFHCGRAIARAEGVQRLLEACERHRALPLAESVTEIVHQLRGEEPASDDILFLAVEV